MPKAHWLPTPPPQTSQSLPEIIGIKEPRESLVQIHNVNIPLPVIPHHSARKFALLLIPLDIDTQAPIHPQAQQDLVLDGVAAPGPSRIPALDTLQLQLLQPRPEVRQLAREPLRLHLEVRRGLCGAELLRVEPRDLGRVLGGGVRGDQLGVLRLEGAQLPGEFFQGLVGLLALEVAGLLEGGEGVVYAGYRYLVWADVEILDCVVNELF
jgi:hypothetical protein